MGGDYNTILTPNERFPLNNRDESNETAGYRDILRSNPDCYDWWQTSGDGGTLHETGMVRKETEKVSSTGSQDHAMYKTSKQGKNFSFPARII
jgi:hypothetical protein